MTTQAPISPTIGSRIKEKRQEEGISIRELARRTNLTASFISQVENEKANVSLESLRRISESLEVPLLYFLAGLETVNEAAPKEEKLAPPENMAGSHLLLNLSSPLIKANMRPRLFLPESGITYELLTNRLDRKMEAFIGELAPGTENVAYRLNIATEEFIYCIAGALKVGVRDQTYILRAGDSIYFEGDELTGLSSGSDTETTVWLSVITPPAF